MLKESEMRYRRLFETAQDGILILDFETGKIIDANPFILNIIDCPLKDILGKKLWEIGLFINKEQSELSFTELKTNSYIRFEDMPIQKINGQINDVEFISNVYWVNDIKVIQCNIRDITERKQNERKQELSNKILSILSSQDNWKMLINDILVEIQKHTGIEAVGIRLKDNDDYPYYEAKGFSKNFMEVEKYLCSLDKKGEIIRDIKGNPYLECMCGNVISKRTDPAFPYFTKGGSYYSNYLSCPVAADLSGEIQTKTCNRCSSEGYESIALIPLYSAKEIIGLLQLNDKRAGMFSLEMIQFFEKTGNSIGIAYTRIKNENKIKENEQNLKKQNVNYLNLNLEYSILNAELIKTLNNIQKINDELITSKIKAEESDKLKSAFLANMSHEIRTPMNAIMGFAEFLLQPGLTKEKIADFVQIINSSSLQLLSVISDVIDISKLEAGQIIIDSELINLNTLFNELFVIYKKIVELKKLRFYCSCENSNDFINIKSDKNRIKQIFCNLLNNALKFTLEGEIEFGYKIKENFIEFYVKDTGIGIAPENHTLIFQRFRQVEITDGREYGGNGLGLSISKALIEKLGGTITVNSELGKGSYFAFTVPYEPIIENNIENEPTTSIDQHNWNEKTILLVEDEAHNHAYAEELLKVTHARILHAWDGKQALEQVKNHPDISLVIMDIKMPVMNGYEATRHIKQIRPKLPVIAQTAYALSHDRKQALEAGCDNYMPKPLDKVLFMEVINNYLS
jgi:PAS domain S-box-containing protein